MNHQDIMRNTINAFVVVEQFYKEISEAFNYAIKTLSQKDLTFYSPGGDAVFCTISKSINKPDSWFMKHPAIFFVNEGSDDPTNETLPNKALSIALYADASYHETPLLILSVYHSFVYEEDTNMEKFKRLALWAFWDSAGPSPEQVSIKQWESLGEISKAQLGTFNCEAYFLPLENIVTTADLDQKVIDVLYAKYDSL